MLIWIKAPYVAIGVLASFVLLLSTVVSEQVDQNATSDDTHFIASVHHEAETIQLMELPFSSSLLNPCSWENPYARPPPFSIMEHRARFLKEFYNFVKHYAKLYKDDAEEVIRNHTIAGCAELHVGYLPNTPTLEELQAMDASKALNKIYSSLLIHSAYSYFIHHQVVNTGVSCEKDIPDEQKLANQSHSMALKQKALACYVLVGITVLGYEREDITPVLSENISRLTLCSRRGLRDCQVLKSTYKFFETIFSYISEKISESSTSSTSTSSSTTTTISLSSITTSSTSTTPINSASSTSSTSSITRTTD